MKISRITSSVLIALTMSSSALAMNEELNYQSEYEDEFMDYYGGEEFVSIATGTQKSITKAPAIASVITSDYIEKVGATNLDEVLELIPGLHVSPSTESRLDPVYSVRGLQTGFNPQILVLLNGTEFKNSFSGGLPFTFRLPAKNIERVEVIRGPGSALYGADAFSGVVNIVTKDQGNNNEINLGGRLGSFKSRDFWLQFGTKIQDLELDFSVESQTSDGDPDRIVDSDLQNTLDNALGTNVSFAPGSLQTQYDILDLHASATWNNLKLEHWYWEQNDGGLGPGGAQALDPIGTQNVEQYRTKLSYRSDLSRDLIFSTNVSHLVVDNETYFVLFPAGAILPIAPDGNLNFSNVAGIVEFTEGYIGSPRSDHKDTRMEASFDYNGFENHEIRVSAGWFEQALNTSEFKNFGPGIINGTEQIVSGELTDITDTQYEYVPDSKRTNRHLVLQDIWQLGQDWEVTLGLRYDSFSDFGSTVNPRIALVWDAAHDLTIKALYGSAFRAPSFNEQFLQNNPSAIGNPNLEPEEIDTYEFGLNYQINFNTKLSLNFYSFKADKLISRAPVEGSNLLLTKNLSTLDGKGVELEVNWSYDDFRIDFHYSHQNTENPSLDKNIPFVAQNTAYLGAFFDMNDKWNISLSSHWIASRERASSDTRNKIDNYILTNVASTYQITDQTKTKLIIKNIFDEAIYEPSSGTISNDFRMPTRSIWLELESKFSF